MGANHAGSGPEDLKMPLPCLIVAMDLSMTRVHRRTDEDGQAA